MTDKSEYGMLFVLEDKMALNLRNNVKSISYVKTNAAEMMNYVNEHRNPIIITQNGEARAVLMDINTYQDNEDALALLCLLRIAEKDIESGKVKDSEVVFKELREKFKKNG